MKRCRESCWVEIPRPLASFRLENSVCLLSKMLAVRCVITVYFRIKMIILLNGWAFCLLVKLTWICSAYDFSGWEAVVRTSKACVDLHRICDYGGQSVVRLTLLGMPSRWEGFIFFNIGVQRALVETSFFWVDIFRAQWNVAPVESCYCLSSFEAI